MVPALFFVSRLLCLLLVILLFNLIVLPLILIVLLLILLLLVTLLLVCAVGLLVVVQVQPRLELTKMIKCDGR